MQKRLRCREANQQDLVDFLEKLGHKPQKSRGNDYWYLSPLRNEKTASFKVDRARNIWYDHGNGQGGTLIDFGKAYFRCTVRELLDRLNNEGHFSFHPPLQPSAGEKKDQQNTSVKIRILEDRELNDPRLKHYLESRKIPLDIARVHCREISFEIYGKKQLAIGFRNTGGGYELRNPYFKGSSTPKEPRLITQPGSKELVVFEGIFSFLSYLTLEKFKHTKNNPLPKQQSNILVLNSIAFFEKSRELMEKYELIHLCLDRDKMGRECTEKALKWSPKYRDHSKAYEKYKDLNEYLVNSQNMGFKQTRSRGMRP